MSALIEYDLLIPREICAGQSGNGTGFPPVSIIPPKLCTNTSSTTDDIILATDGAVMSLSGRGLIKPRSIYTIFIEEFSD
jgi:hypothetical protein